MEKEEIALIIIKVSADGQDALHLKIYKDGTTCRYGVGGLPQLGISGMSFMNDTRYFKPLCDVIPPAVLEKPVHYTEETPNGYLEYVVAFFGASANGETGERAQWTKNTGLQFKLDSKSKFNHVLLRFADSFAMEAARLTNEWYFDVIVKARFDATSNTLPPETIITQPKTEAEIHEQYANYVNQMLQSRDKWNMAEYAHNKLYTLNGLPHVADVQQAGAQFGLHFYPLNAGPVPETTPKPASAPPLATPRVEKKPWWKIW